MHELRFIEMIFNDGTVLCEIEYTTPFCTIATILLVSLQSYPRIVYVIPETYCPRQLDQHLRLRFLRYSILSALSLTQHFPSTTQGAAASLARTLQKQRISAPQDDTPQNRKY